MAQTSLCDVCDSRQTIHRHQRATFEKFAEGFGIKERRAVMSAGDDKMSVVLLVVADQARRVLKRPEREGKVTFDAQKYLDYLDKEMTIMGVLSAFCALVPALALARVGSASASDTPFYQLWQYEYWYVVVGCVSFILAAAAFYRQRSWLAWFYGQISLSTLDVYKDGWDTKQWLKEADSWATWVPYRAAFWLTGLGFGEYGAALIGLPYLRFAALVWLPFLLAAGIETPYLMILSSEKYKFADEPLKQFLNSFLAK